MVTTLKQLRAQARKIAGQIDAIESKRRQADALRFVGRCFKFRNSYSCPTEEEKWWLYIKVLEAHDGGLVLFEFQTDRDGKIDVRPSYDRWPGMLDGSYIEIEPSEFDREWEALQNYIAGMRP